MLVYDGLQWLYSISRLSSSIVSWYCNLTKHFFGV